MDTTSRHPRFARYCIYPIVFSFFSFRRCLSHLTSLLLFLQGYVRWPPHINMAYPFLPYEKLAAAAEQLTAAFSAVQPFPLRFGDFDLFEHGKSSCTVWLKPQPNVCISYRSISHSLNTPLPQPSSKTTLSQAILCMSCNK